MNDRTRHSITVSKWRKRVYMWVDRLEGETRVARIAKAQPHFLKLAQRGEHLLKLSIRLGMREAHLLEMHKTLKRLAAASRFIHRSVGGDAYQGPVDLSLGDFKDAEECRILMDEMDLERKERLKNAQPNPD